MALVHLPGILEGRSLHGGPGLQVLTYPHEVTDLKTKTKKGIAVLKCHGPKRSLL